MPTERRAFAPDPASVPAARRFVTDALQAWGLDSVQDWAALAVSELATNAVRHAATPFEVELDANGDVSLAVADESPVEPVVRQSGPADTRGRGMHLVQRLSDRWGVVASVGGKRVWCSIRRPA